MRTKVFAPALVAFIALAPAAQVHAAPLGAAATTNVNVRASAWGTVIGTAPTDSTWVRTGRTDQGFAEVSFRGRRAWISMTYLRDATGAGVQVTASSLNVRSDASTSATVVGQAHATEAYAKNQDSANGLWALIRFDENRRWVHRGYTTDFSLGGSLPSTQPTPTPGSGATFVARGTGYYPANTLMEGGFFDRKGKKLRTLQQYLAGSADYVSVAMDSKAFPYGTKLRIREFEQRYGRTIEFRVVDTGGAFKGTGTSRIDICVANRTASYDATVNGTLHCTVAP
ncbi:MAG: hypothetical protein ACAI25_00910 [Planctomycetota bacterium]